MKRCCAWSGSARRNSRSAAPRRCAVNCLRFVFSLIRKKRFDYFITLYQLAARRVPTGKSATPRSCTTRRGLADMADWSGCPSIAAMPSTSRIDVMCQFQKWRRSTYPTRGRSGSSRPRSAGERDPSRASNGNGTKRRRQAETILSRSARRWRDPSTTALTISGGEVKGVPPGNGGAGSYSIES